MERSGPILRKLFGQIRLEPTQGDIGRPTILRGKDVTQYLGVGGGTAGRRPGRQFEFNAMVDPDAKNSNRCASTI
jgi:hypothetical protein